MTKEILWYRRLENFKKAFALFTRIVNQSEKDGQNEIIELAAILSFTQNFTLATDCLLKFFEDQGEIYLEPGKKIIRLAFRRGLIENGEIWMRMLETHKKEDTVFQKKIAQEISKEIIENFYPELLKLCKKLIDRKSKHEEFYKKIKEAA